MAQRAYWNKDDDDSTFDLSQWFLGMFEPGVYRGFNYIPSGTMNASFNHLGGNQSPLEDLTGLQPRKGLLITRQGVVIKEDSGLTIPIQPGHPTLPRIDRIICTHNYEDVAGGSPAIYAAVQGTPAATPHAPNVPFFLTDLSIGTLFIPAGTTALTDPGVVFTPDAAPHLANRADDYNKSNQYATAHNYAQGSTRKQAIEGLDAALAAVQANFPIVFPDVVLPIVKADEVYPTVEVEEDLTPIVDGRKEYIVRTSSVDLGTTPDIRKIFPSGLYHGAGFYESGIGGDLPEINYYNNLVINAGDSMIVGRRYKVFGTTGQTITYTPVGTLNPGDIFSCVTGTLQFTGTANVQEYYQYNWGIDINTFTGNDKGDQSTYSYQTLKINVSAWADGFARDFSPISIYHRLLTKGVSSGITHVTPWVRMDGGSDKIRIGNILLHGALETGTGQSYTNGDIQHSNFVYDQNEDNDTIRVKYKSAIQSNGAWSNVVSNRTGGDSILAFDLPLDGIQRIWDLSVLVETYFVDGLAQDLTWGISVGSKVPVNDEFFYIKSLNRWLQADVGASSENTASSTNGIIFVHDGTEPKTVRIHVKDNGATATAIPRVKIKYRADPAKNANVTI